MAAEIANNMSVDEKNNIENMNIEKMISHVTKNMFKIMNNNENNDITLQINEASKTKDISFDLDVTLEELYNGKKKKINVKINKSIEGNIVNEKIKLIVDIKKGMKNGDTIIFEGKSDQLDGYIPGDIIIKLVQKPHLVFERKDNDLYFKKTIQLYEVYDNSFYINHLDSRILKIINTEHIGNFTKKIKGEGMINEYNGKIQKGDLYIQFSITLPKRIKNKDIKILKNILLVNNKEKNMKYENHDDEYYINDIPESTIDSESSNSSNSDSSYTTDSDSNSET